MARQILSSNPSAPLAAEVLAHNSLLFVLGGAFVHADGPDIDASGVLLYPSGGAPGDLAAACTFLSSAKTWWNVNHLPYVGGGYAHAALDAVNPVSSSISTGAAYTETIRAALATAAAQHTTAYEAHRTNTGGAFHTGPDTVDIVGTSYTVSTLSQIAERLNLLKLVVDLHEVNTTGVHGATGVADAISAPNCTDTDLDSMIVLENAIRAALIAHLGRGAAIHPGGADAVNLPAGSAVTYPAGMFSLATEWVTKFPTHTTNAGYHYNADTVAAPLAAPSTVTGLIAWAADFYTKLLAHMTASPGAGTGEALRIV